MAEQNSTGGRGLPNIGPPNYRSHDSQAQTPGSPNYEEVYVDPNDPESLGAEPAFSSVGMPSFYKGALDAATFLIDFPTMVAGKGLAFGADLLGLEESAKRLRNPITIGKIATEGFELPQKIETAITGKDPTLTSGFSATPREAQNEQERFLRDAFYITGGGISFPTSLAGVFGNLLKSTPVRKLIEDAAGRGSNSVAAQNALKDASKMKNMKPVQALGEVAKQYAAKFTTGLGTRPLKTLSFETGMAGLVGAGYGAPEFAADKDGRIMLNLGKDFNSEGEVVELGEVDVAPTLKLFSSLGLPIALAHTPSGVLSTANPEKALPLIKAVMKKGAVFAKSLIGGVTKEGQYDLASRIFNEMATDQAFLVEKFLPAVEAGVFKTPGSSSPILRITDDGVVIPERGGLRPDTLQAFKQLGFDDTRLAALDAALRGKGKNLDARIAEETRRAEALERVFEKLKANVSGDESATYSFTERIRTALDKEVLDNLEAAKQKVREVYEILEPVIGGPEASKLSVELLNGARLTSRGVRKELWDPELTGVEYVDTRSLGDWAMAKIMETQTARTGSISPGMGIYYKLAGKKRLNDNGFGASGKPLTKEDLQGAKGDGDVLLEPSEIGPNGLFDIYGAPGTVSSRPIRMDDLDKFRSEMGDLAYRARRAGNEKLGRRYSLIIDEIDDVLLSPENLSKSWLDDLDQTNIAPEELAAWREYIKTAPENANLRNIKIARAYSKDAKERFGPNSEIGRILYTGTKPIPEEFLQRLLRQGPGSGARVSLFRDALNEPQKVIDGDSVTWVKDPAATLTMGDNPNAIEAEILRRFTLMVPSDGAVTQKSVDSFLRRWGDAVDEIPGLRAKFNDLKNLQGDVDIMAGKLTVPDRQAILNSLKKGAEIEDVQTANIVLNEKLIDRRLANQASDYLEQNVNEAATNFINADSSTIAKRADEISALLAKDETGEAARGFRAALWRALKDSSVRRDKDNVVVPGINTAKLTETKERLRPFLEKFWDKSQMEYLDEIVKGGPLQRTGTLISKAEVTPQDIMAGTQGFGTVETVSAAGRTLGQKLFGQLGINPLVATGMGRRIAAYTFSRMGEERILKHVEDALRDPEKAAALVKRFKELPEWTPSPRTQEVGENVISDPKAVIKTQAQDGVEKLKGMAAFAAKYLRGHSRESIERAVKYGLLPAQAEGRKMDLEEDWELGPPYVYRENKARSAIESQQQREFEEEDDFGVGPSAAVTPPAPPPRQVSRAAVTPSAPPPLDPQRVPNSALAAANPLMARGREIFGANDPVFAGHGGYIGGAGSGVGRLQESNGIMSVKRKARQLVG